MGNNKFTTIKIWKETLNRLRVVAAIQGSSMASVLDGLVSKLYHKEKEQWKK